jgi:hypothetical protein
MIILILCIYIQRHSRLCRTEFLETPISHSLVDILYGAILFVFRLKTCFGLVFD